MDAFLGIINNPLVLTLVQLGFGVAIKKVPWLAAWPNKLIPLFNGVLALLVKIAVPDADAGILGIDVKGAGGFLLNAVVEAAGQTLISTGIHSTGKNVWQQFVLAVLRPRR